MAGKSPWQRADDLVRGTRLADVAVRRRLIDGGLAAIEASNDPMIRLARLVDRPARASAHHVRAGGPGAAALGLRKAGQYPLRALGTETYPDATVTLRLAFGTVKGYRDNGQQIPPWTTIAGLYRTAESTVLPSRSPCRKAGSITRTV